MSEIPGLKECGILKSIKYLLVMLLVSLTAGCATSRSVIDVADEVSRNPAQGQAIKFVQVTDQRDFQLKPSQPNIPSLKDGAIRNRAITDRAIARKRNTYGMAMGDILLPEGHTVMQVVENRLAAGFRDAGYRVLSANDPGYSAAIPVQVAIKKFWGWYSPGWTSTLNFETAVVLTAPLPGFNNGLEFSSRIEEQIRGATETKWQRVIDNALDDLSDDIEAQLNQR